jgi:hypothetical protein
MGERILPVALFVALGIVAFRENRSGRFPPRPSVFIGVALVYSILSLLMLGSPGLAAAFAVAFDIGLAIRGAEPAPVNLKVIQGSTPPVFDQSRAAGERR